MRVSRGPGRLRALVAMAMLAAPQWAAAQAVGSGPLTETLTEVEPTAGILNFGSVKVAPGFIVQELGWDSNVFDEHEDQKEDWVFRGTPDVSVFSALRWVKLSAYAASDLQYYKTYESERNVGYQYRARLDTNLSRLHPFVGAGRIESRTRPNGEIDVRADQEEEEISGGVAFDLGPHSKIYGSAVRYRTLFENGVQDGVDLPSTLNRYSYSYSGGVRTDITPITSLTVSGDLTRDEFDTATLRNSETRAVSASLKIGTEAQIAGVVTLGYNDFQPEDPLVEPYRGVSAQAVLTYAVLELGRLTGTFNRGQEYSFDDREAYYLETTYGLSYTHRLFGEVDAQVRGGRSIFNYGFREGSPDRDEHLDSGAVSLGYNLRNRTRIALNYELARRRAPSVVERNYDRTRVYVSWLYAL
jgi:Putative beta-barrel porin 2